MVFEADTPLLFLTNKSKISNRQNRYLCLCQIYPPEERAAALYHHEDNCTFLTN